MNVLVDTNVLLSAAIRDRLPERVVLYIASDQRFRWLVTPEILQEYVAVLSRPKFGLDDEALSRWSGLLDLQTVKVASPPFTVDLPRDPKDAPFLAAALASDADFLITGDQDLLQLAGKVPTRIVTISDFAAEFQIS